MQRLIKNWERTFQVAEADETKVCQLGTRWRHKPMHKMRLHPFALRENVENSLKIIFKKFL